MFTSVFGIALVPDTVNIVITTGGSATQGAAGGNVGMHYNDLYDDCILHTLKTMSYREVLQAVAWLLPKLAI